MTETNINNYIDDDFETFKRRCEEVSYYQGGRERTTLDDEWTESELKDDLQEEVHKYLHGDSNTDGWLKKNTGRLLKDNDLTKDEYLVEQIVNEIDLIEEYNKAYDKHRNDENRKFGITYFDEFIIGYIKKTLKNNMVTQ